MKNSKAKVKCSREILLYAAAVAFVYYISHLAIRRVKFCCWYSSCILAPGTRALICFTYIYLYRVCPIDVFDDGVFQQ